MAIHHENSHGFHEQSNPPAEVSPFGVHVPYLFFPIIAVPVPYLFLKIFSEEEMKEMKKRRNEQIEFLNDMKVVNGMEQSSTFIKKLLHKNQDYK